MQQPSSPLTRGLQILLGPDALSRIRIVDKLRPEEFKIYVYQQLTNNAGIGFVVDDAAGGVRIPLTPAGWKKQS